MEQLDLKSRIQIQIISLIKNHPSDCVSLLRLLVMEPRQSINTQSLGLQTTLRLTEFKTVALDFKHLELGVKSLLWSFPASLAHSRYLINTCRMLNCCDVVSEIQNNFELKFPYV